VVKAVPAGATVVGIPGHIVDNSNSKTSKEREKIASKMGFNAYGATADMPDPVTHSLNRMLDHIHLMDKQIETMKQALNEAGIECKGLDIPELDDCEIKE
jgi:serine O-acetyltransferase